MTTTQRTIVITGATGFVGRQVARQAAARGHTVVGVTRDVQAARRSNWASVDRWVGLGGTEMASAIDESGCVINLAGVHPFSGRWTRAMKRAIHDTRIETTRLVATALRESSARDKVLVNAAGTPIWGDRGDEPIDDDTPPAADGFLPRMIRAWEAAGRTSGARFVSLRIGLAFGAEGFGPFQLLSAQFRRFLGGHPGNGRQFLPWLHVDDCARMFVAAAEDTRWEGAFVCASPNPARARDVACAVGRALGRPSWLHPPAGLLRLMLGEAACLLLDSQRAIPRRAQQLGFTFEHPELTAALAAIVARQMRPPLAAPAAAA